MDILFTLALLSAIGVGHLYFRRRAFELIESLPNDERRRINRFLAEPWSVAAR